jgi:hypothetical protein
MPGKGVPRQARQGGQLGRGHCERGGLGHEPVTGVIEALYQEHAALACWVEWEVAVRLGYPRLEHPGEVPYTLSEPFQLQR